jgi:phosphate transport system substrate-binding protein
MFGPIPRAATALLLIALCGFVDTAAAQETLRLHGSNTIGQRLAPALAREWATARGYTVTDTRTAVAEEVTLVTARDGQRLDIQIHSHGTGTGFGDLLAGRADLWMASRPVSAAELAQARPIGDLAAPAQEHVVALDGLAIIVNPANPIGALTVAQVRDIFAGRIRDWSAVGGAAGEIRLYARDDKSGTFDTFRSMVLRDVPISAAARRYESTDQLSTDVVADRDGIGFVGLAGVGRAKALAVSDPGTRPITPDRVMVGTEDYVLSRRLFLYNRADAGPLVEDFIEFVLGSGGQAVVERIGFVSQAVAAVDVPSRPGLPGEYQQFTDGAQRLTMNFRFAAGSATLDNKALRDVERLVDFLGGQANRKVELMLFGFVDGNEINPYQALTLSNERADLVAQALVSRGVGARRVRGMGDSAPVAANDSEAGRFKNRRVEVWVRPLQRPADVEQRLRSQAARESAADTPSG